MADMYVDNAGSNTSPYETWAKAATNMDTAIAAIPDGDTIWVKSDHTESTAGAMNLDPGAAHTAPVRVISVGAAVTNEPPVAGDYESMITGGGDITCSDHDVTLGGNISWHGVHIQAGNDILLNGGENIHIYDSRLKTPDDFRMGANGSGMNDHIYLEDVQFELTTGGHIRLDGAVLLWRGGSFIFSGAGAVTSCFTCIASKPSVIRVVGVDFSGLNVADYLYANNTALGHQATFERCKTPTWDTGGLFSGTIELDQSWVKFFNCSDSDTIYEFQENYLTGQVNESTSVYLNATYDGTNEYSAYLASSASAFEWYRPLRYKLCDVWAAANPTIRVEFVNDGTTYQDDELWVEVEYPDGTLATLGNLKSSKPATILTTPSNVPASGVSWTGTGGFGGEVKQYIDVTIADGDPGIHRIWVCLAKASDNVYADPKVTIS